MKLHCNLCCFLALSFLAVVATPGFFVGVASSATVIQEKSAGGADYYMQGRMHLTDTAIPLDPKVKEALDKIHVLEGTIRLQKAREKKLVGERNELLNSSQATEAKWQKERKILLDTALHMEGKLKVATRDIQNLKEQLAVAAENERRLMLEREQSLGSAFEVKQTMMATNPNVPWGRERKKIIDMSLIMEGKANSCLKENKVLREKVDAMTERDNWLLADRQRIIETASLLESNLNEQVDAAKKQAEKLLNERKMLINTALNMEKKFNEQRRTVDALTKSETKWKKDRKVLIDSALSMERKLNEHNQCPKSIATQDIQRLKEQVDAAAEREASWKEERKVLINTALLMKNRWKNAGAGNTAESTKLQEELEMERKRVAEVENDKRILLERLASSSAEENKNITCSASHLTSDEVRELQGRGNASVEEEVFSTLASKMRTIERDVGKKWKAYADRLAGELQEARQKVDVLHAGAKTMAKDNAKETRAHSEELDSLRRTLGAEIDMLRGSLKHCRGY